MEKQKRKKNNKDKTVRWENKEIKEREKLCLFCCVCVGSRDPQWLHQSLDDIHSGSNAPVPHLTQVFGVGVGEVGEKGDDQRREEIGRVDEAAQHQAEGGQNGEESVAGGQT